MAEPTPAASTNESITEAITGAVEDAQMGQVESAPSTDAGSSAPIADTPGSGSVPGSVPSSAGPISPSSAAAPVPAAPVIEPDASDKSEVDKMLEEAGIHPPAEGERPNRIPQPRVKKMTEALVKKLETRHTAEITPLKQKLAELEPAMKLYQNQERLATTDPDGFIAALARFDARYQKFLQPTPGSNGHPTPATPPPAARPPAEDKMPEPDTPDGYSIQGLARRDAWVQRQVEASILGRLKPILDEHQNREITRSIAPKVNAERKELERVFGADALKKHESALVKALGEHPGVSSFQVISAVLVPLLKAEAMADRTKIRTEVLKEINAAPAAASRGTPSPAVTPGNTGPRSLEDTIREAIAPFR